MENEGGEGFTDGIQKPGGGEAVLIYFAADIQPSPPIIDFKGIKDFCQLDKKGKKVKKYRQRELRFSLL